MSGVRGLYECSANLRVVLFLAGLLVCLHAALLHLNVRRDQSKHSTSTRKLTYINIQQITTSSRLECVCYKSVLLCSIHYCAS